METETGLKMEDIKIEMMPNRVLVQIAERVSKGGLVLPESVKKKLGEGIVIQAGPPNIPVQGSPDIKGGERIIYYKGGGDPIAIGKEECIVIQIMDIYLVLHRGEIPKLDFTEDLTDEISCADQGQDVC